jgi:hypothetical protein
MTIDTLESDGIRYAEVMWANVTVERTTFFLGFQSPLFNFDFWLTKRAIGKSLCRRGRVPAASRLGNSSRGLLPWLK